MQENGEVPVHLTQRHLKLGDTAGTGLTVSFSFWLKSSLKLLQVALGPTELHTGPRFTVGAIAMTRQQGDSAQGQTPTHFHDIEHRMMIRPGIRLIKCRD